MLIPQLLRAELLNEALPSFETAPPRTTTPGLCSLRGMRAIAGGLSAPSRFFAPIAKGRDIAGLTPRNHPHPPQLLLFSTFRAS